MLDQIKNGMLRHVWRAAAPLLAAAALASPAVAGTYRIDFYNLTSITGAPDYDGDGVVDYSGTFDAAAGVVSPVTAFGVTIDGVAFNALDSGSFPGAPKYYEPSGSWPIPYIDGFVFHDLFSGSGDTVDVLQMFSIGIGDGSGGVDYYGLWAISPCTSGSWCGGGQARGSYTITAANPVPTPATLPLAALGLLALVAVRRRAA